MIGLSAASWTVISVVLGTAGVLILFRYGMPFRLESRGMAIVTVEDESELDLDRRYKRFGYLGLILTLAGGFCQIIAAYA